MRTAHLLILLGAPALAEAPVSLRLSFTHGQQLGYRMHVEQSAELALDQASGETRRTRTVSDIELILRALEVTDAGSRLEVMVENFSALQLMEGKRLPLPNVREMQGLRLEMHLSPRGEVTGARVLDPARLPPPLLSLAESLCRTLEQLSLPLAAEPVRPSDSWPVERRIPLVLDGIEGIEFEAKGRAELLRLENCRRHRCAWLAADLALSIKGAGGGGLGLGADIEGRAEISAQLALDSGQLLRSLTKMEISGELSATQDNEQVRTRARLSSTVRLEVIK